MNDKNQMDLDTEKVRKKKKRQEIINKFLDKFQQWKEKVEEWIEQKKAESAEKKEYLKTHPEEKWSYRKKKTSNVQPSTKRASTFQKERTITNDTIRGDKTESGYEKRSKERKKEKRRRIFSNIMTIPEIILIVFLAIFLKDKYLEYSKEVHQVLTYKAG